MTFYQMPLTEAVLQRYGMHYPSHCAGLMRSILHPFACVRKQFADRQDVVLVCSDQTLNEAAHQLKVTVVDPVYRSTAITSCKPTEGIATSNTLPD